MFNQFTFSSLETGSRADSTTNYTDWELVKAGRCEPLSVFGYNSGALQFVQLFDAPAAPTVSITDTDETTDVFTAASHGLHMQQRVQVTGISGITNDTICYVRYLSANTFSLYDTAAHALAGGATGLLDADTADDTGTIKLVPKHSFAIGAADNFSVIIPVTGFGFSKGLVVATSSTGPLYTAAASKLVNFCATLKA